MRLYVLTGDEYFLHIARLLEKNTKQTMDYDGTLGYAYRGLQTEALRLVTRWGDGVNLWLPWVTASALDPLFKIRDAYGDMDIERIGTESLSTLRQKDAVTQGNHKLTPSPQRVTNLKASVCNPR